VLRTAPKASRIITCITFATKLSLFIHSRSVLPIITLLALPFLSLQLAWRVTKCIETDVAVTPDVVTIAKSSVTVAAAAPHGSVVVAAAAADVDNTGDRESDGISKRNSD
jgi:hypothetical protein